MLIENNMQPIDIINDYILINSYSSLYYREKPIKILKIHCRNGQCKIDTILDKKKRVFIRSLDNELNNWLAKISVK